MSVALLRPLSELLGKLGEAPAAFLETVGVTDDMPPNAYVPARAVDRALDQIAERRGDPALALTLATATVGRPLGLFGHMLWTSGTLGDALERAVKHYGMVSQRSVLRLETSGELVRMRSIAVAKEPRGRILAEYPFASLALRARAATGGAFRMRAVRFRHAGADGPRYTDAFRAPVEFGARHDELELATSQLALPLATADELTQQVLEAKVVQLTGSPGASFVERVRLAAADQLEASPDEIARVLGVSTRTLRRHLDQHGATLRGVVDGLRRERADALLARGMTVKEVAFALAFSEPSAFSRAYKRWTGKAPKAARR
jgi:AraC-like DNA-binding protein